MRALALVRALALLHGEHAPPPVSPGPPKLSGRAGAVSLRLANVSAGSNASERPLRQPRLKPCAWCAVRV